MQGPDADNVDPDGARSLTLMMQVGSSARGLWSPEELGPMLAHQLSAPLECDLGRLEKGLGRRLEEFVSGGGPPIRSFHDLLHRPSPPLDLLELTRRFAKGCRTNPDSPLPGEIATVLYFLSIAVALTRCGRRITKMDDQSLRYSFNWVVNQPWVDEPSRELLREGLTALGPSQPEPQ